MEVRRISIASQNQYRPNFKANNNEQQTRNRMILGGAIVAASAIASTAAIVKSHNINKELKQALEKLKTSETKAKELENKLKEAEEKAKKAIDELKNKPSEPKQEPKIIKQYITVKERVPAESVIEQKPSVEKFVNPAGESKPIAKKADEQVIEVQSGTGKPEAAPEDKNQSGPGFIRRVKSYLKDKFNLFNNWRAKRKDAKQLKKEDKSRF